MSGTLVLALALGILTLGLLIRMREYSMKVRDQEIENHALRHDLRTANQALHEMSQLMTTLADASFDALLVIDSTRHITAINQAARDLFGVDASAIGKTLMTVTRQHELDAMVNSVLSGKETFEPQFKINDRSFRARAVVVGSALTLALQDISELLRLSRARRDMVANFSHDLRTPVSSIRLLVDSLLRNFGRNSERDQRSLAKIAAETDNLQHMTQELIDLSMIESGQAILRMVEVNFTDILSSAHDAMATQIEQKKLELINDTPPGLRVLADPEQTRRVITNLVHNSVKFTPSEGKITFSAACKGEMVTICVRDTGPGIPPQERARIFERFYQIDTSRTNQQSNSGSGLGLSIAKHIIEAQGGRIWAEAGNPKGACICFTLPLATEHKSTLSVSSISNE